MFEGQETFTMGRESKKWKEFVFINEIKLAKNFKYVLAVFYV